MPSLGSHLARAYEVAERLRLPEVEADRGSYFLGATAPDIRVITRRDRRVTHFYDLADHGAQDSVARMFEENPEIATPAGLEAATVAFLAGYVTHLALDEAYIEDVYRPEFGLDSPMGDDPRRNVLDRALQYELDRRDREDGERMLAIRGALRRCAPRPHVPFIEEQHLVEWAEVVDDFASHPPDYTRFRRMMLRHLRDAGLTEEEIEACCEDPLAVVQEALARVGEQRVRRFWDDAAERIDVKLRRFLR